MTLGRFGVHLWLGNVLRPPQAKFLSLHSSRVLLPKLLQLP